MLLNKVKCDNLEMVIETFRHGAREPVYNLYDAQEFNRWGHFEGELTAVGQRMHYILGMALRKHYIDDLGFLTDAFNFTEFHVRSTDINRTLMSAESQLLGWYPDFTGPILPGEVDVRIAVPPWPTENLTEIPFQMGMSALPYRHQVIPVHTIQTKIDYLLKSYDSGTCPAMGPLEQAQYQTDFWKSLELEFDNTFQQLKQIITQNPPFEFVQLPQLMDVFQNFIYSGRPIPAETSPGTELYKNLTFLYPFGMYYGLFGTKLQQQIASQNYFLNMISHFDQKIANSSLFPLKWEMQSAHDTTVAGFTPFLNITSWQCIYDLWTTNQTSAINCHPEYPSYATNLIVELYNFNDTLQGYYVKIMYQGVYVNMCAKVNNTQCSYSEFRQRLVDQFLPDFMAACMGTSAQMNSQLIIQDDHRVLTAQTHNAFNKPHHIDIEDKSYVTLICQLLIITAQIGIIAYLKLRKQMTYIKGDKTNVSNKNTL